jgi:hypothetical protein
MFETLDFNFVRCMLWGVPKQENVMTTLNDEVRSVVESFLKSGELFTALDVSNKVKMALPFARHREVRDVVRAMYTTDIEVAGWARTPINVTLADGSMAEALLYHPLSDAWDLDNKYDLQRRAGGAVKTSPAPVVAAPVAVPATVSKGVVTVTPAASIPTPAPVVTPAAISAKDQWAQLFNSQPSLFPRK